MAFHITTREGGGCRQGEARAAREAVPAPHSSEDSGAGARLRCSASPPAGPARHCLQPSPYLPQGSNGCWGGAGRGHRLSLGPRKRPGQLLAHSESPSQGQALLPPPAGARFPPGTSGRARGPPPPAAAAARQVALPPCEPTAAATRQTRHGSACAQRQGRGAEQEEAGGAARAARGAGRGGPAFGPLFPPPTLLRGRELLERAGSGCARTAAIVGGEGGKPLSGARGPSAAPRRHLCLHSATAGAVRVSLCRGRAVAAPLPAWRLCGGGAERLPHGLPGHSARIGRPDVLCAFPPPCLQPRLVRGCRQYGMLRHYYWDIAFLCKGWRKEICFLSML